MRFGLERMGRLLSELGDPQDAFPAVHVVGTNGKSSTTLMTAAGLRSQGLTVGAFTSPHLISFRERIDLNGVKIDAVRFAAAGARVRRVIERLDESADTDDRVTQFEAITAIGFVAFDADGLDAAVIEAGLGGRLDATNVLGDSRVQVLTSVGIDHTQYLGDTIEAITREKVAVVRSNSALVSGPLGPAASVVVNAMTDERDARWIEAHGEDPAFAELSGEFVRANASLALAVTEVALPRIRHDEAFIRERAVAAISSLATSGQLVGRLEMSNSEPFEVRDSAHNSQAATALAAALGEVAAGRPVTLLVAMLKDKPIHDTLSELLKAVPADGVVVCTQASNPRSLPAAELAERVSALAGSDVRVESVTDPLTALGRAREIAGRDGLLSVTGSNYLLADLLREPGAPAGATL